MIMIPYPDIDPVLLSLGPLQIRWYGVAYVAGFSIAWALAKRRAAISNSRWTAKQVDDLIFFCAISAIIGGRLGWVLFYGMERVLSEPIRLFYVWEGGMSFHGGLLGALSGATWFASKHGKPIVDVFDFMAPLPGMGILAVRVANFINAELWGKPTSMAIGFRLVASKLHESQAMQVRDLCSRLGVTPCELSLHASQLYEGVLEGLLPFLVVWRLTSRPVPQLAPSGLFLLMYGLARFAVEFVRIPDANRPYFLDGWGTMGQLLSAPLIAVGVSLLCIAYRGQGRLPPTQPPTVAPAMRK